MRKNLLTFAFVLSLAFLASGALAARAEAATYSFATASAVAHLGGEIAVDVMIDPEGQNINTVSATIDLPPNLSYVGEDDSSSIVSYWVDDPTYDPDTDSFSFSGIIPGGFSGQINPFSTDGAQKSEGTVIRLLLRGSVVGAGTISYPAADAYLDDGLGTETRVDTKTLSLVIDTIIGQDLPAIVDTDPPLPFTPYLERDYLLDDGKYVAIFHTEDKGSGMDHYEIKEGNRAWVRATSPYLLVDQSVSHDIIIKAVDRAGNAQYETIPALQHFELWQIVVSIAIILFILLLALLERRRKPKRKAPAGITGLPPSPPRRVIG